MESYLTLFARLTILGMVAYVAATVIYTTEDKFAALSPVHTTTPNSSIAEQPIVEPNYTKPAVVVGGGAAVALLCLLANFLIGLHKYSQTIGAIAKLNGNLKFNLASTSLLLDYIYGTTTLDLCGTKLNNRNFPDLSCLPRLKSLRIAATGVTDSVAKKISACSDLVSLDISDTQLGDATIFELSKLKNLKYIIASRTQITNDSLMALSSMNLKKFECQETALSLDSEYRLATQSCL